jgi:hypothetical protein
VAEVLRQSSLPTPDAIEELVEVLRIRFGDSLEAVLHYGSCLHTGDTTTGIVDLIAVVSDYGSAYGHILFRAFNILLPPNFFYFEIGNGSAKVRAKYGVLSRAHFEAGSDRWLRSYLWARLAQPCRLVWATDEETAERVRAALVRAVLRFHGEALPILSGSVVDTDTFWLRALGETYRSELRPESRDRAAWLVSRNAEDYRSLTAAAMPAFRDVVEVLPDGRYRVTATKDEERRAARRWALRRWQGKVLSTLGMGKSAFTFAGAADYVAEKIKRHTGVTITVTPFMRRHPFICSPYALVSYLWRGIIR